MKYKDLKKMIRDGDWQCDYTLKGFIGFIEQHIEEFGLNMQPDFQRNHVWSEDQQIRFIEALLQGGAKHSRVIYLNYPSWQTEVKEGEYNDFVCVDGLQRYTAIKRFINNEIKAFGFYLDEYEDSDVLKRAFMVKININDLCSKKEVLEWYLQINDGGTPHTEEELNKVKKMLSEMD